MGSGANNAAIVEVGAVYGLACGAPHATLASERGGSASAMPAPMLAGLSAFEREGIAYCYWKSSRRLQSVLAGDGDLDLLVALSDQHRAEAALLNNGFKKFSSVSQRDNPSISSFLGFDSTMGRLIHFHVYYRLMIGQQLFKNYRVPWEDKLLARARFHPSVPVRVLDPCAEALLLAVRSCLELSWTDPVALRHWRRGVSKFAADREYLARLVRAETIHSLASEWLGDELAELVVDSLHGEMSPAKNRRLRHAIQAHFAPWRAYNPAEAHLRAAWRALGWAVGAANQRVLHLPRPWNRRCPGGGRIVALLGVDGSGKSTALSGLRSWLGAEIDVMPIYFGTGGGRPSLWLLPLKLMVPMARPFLGRKPSGASHGDISTKAPGLAYGALLILWAMVLAIEKLSKLARSQRGAQRGLLVLADRYPQDQIPDYNDGPLLHRVPWTPRWIRQFEKRAYRRCGAAQPDLVLKLIASPATLSRREPEMAQALIRSRADSLTRLEFPGARVVCIDAEQPLASVAAAIRGEVWRIL